MVSENGRRFRRAHFLKPSSTSIDGSAAKLPRREEQRRSDTSLQLKRLSSRGLFSGFWFAELHFVSWLGKMEALYGHIWKKAGIFEAIKASAYNITKNPSLIFSVAEKWCSETKSFIFPWGEATITLEDVMVLLGFSVLGSPVFAPLESSEMRDSAEKLEKLRAKKAIKDKRVSILSWISIFLGRGDQMEHEAFLVLWLSFFVFPARSRRSISKHVIPIAVRLARGERIALAPAVLAVLYKDLGQLCDFVRGKCAGKVQFKSLFKLVQVWAWERFRNIRPKAREIPKGEPRIAQWDSLVQRSNKVRMNFDDFDWRPYTKPLKNWNPLRFYLEEAMWVTVDDNLEDEFVSFARCVRSSQLVGIGFVEDYYPNRVAMQFGLAQDLPGLVTLHRHFTEKESWDDYSKSLKGFKLYMPSRLDQERINEAFNARNTFDDDDDDIDVSPNVLPLSQVIQKLEEGFPAKYRRSRMSRLAKRYVHRTRAREDDDESSMDEEAGYMTVSQLIRFRKKFSDVEQPGGDASESFGKRTRRYRVVDSDDDSEPCQNHASMEVEDDDTAKIAEITRQSCDNVNGRHVEKKAMIDDEIKEAESWVHEDRELKKRCIGKIASEVKKEEEVDEKLRQRKLVIERIALELETRIIKVEKSLAKIRNWKARDQTKVGMSLLR
ncbi:hypothetical protein CARUB_v10002577mg [Capsella rubella]|uniref:Aminotransferase-like plant mobile domain-containing protein n=1 Tax=Capsella rubella TaxID=81985 RepID=R0FCN4_9BRAS|nr:hypothetical protein CARUB_v10002577mg [Capsella rubella]